MGLQNDILNLGSNPTDFENYLRHHDVRIDDVRIISFSGLDVSIMEHFNGGGYIEIHEDIFECVLSGRISSIDSANLPMNLSLTGHEFLVIRFYTPGTEKITQVFHIDKITDKIQAEEKQIYDLHFVSSAFINNLFRTVNKSYSGTISSTVKNIFENSVNTDRSPNSIKIKIEPTMGDYKCIIPGWKPNIAINWLKRKAVSLGNYPSSNYVYYQDLSGGFNFVSLSSLYNNPVVATYSSSPIKTSYAREDTNDLDLQKSLTNIEKMKIGGFDQTRESLNGTWSSTLIVHDITTKSYESFWYSYNRDFNAENSLNGYPLLPQLADNFSVQPNSRHYFTPKHAGIYGGVTESDGLELIDYPDNEATWNHIQQHDSNINQLQFNSIEIYVGGDTNRRVGDKVAIQAPDISSSGNSEGHGLDTMVSGIYLITKIKHMLTTGGHQMHMRLCKESHGWALPNEHEYEDGDEAGIAGVYHA